jgi:hypothetical protein
MVCNYLLGIVFVGEFDVKSHQDESDFQRHVHAATKDLKVISCQKTVKIDEDCHFAVDMQLKVSSPYYNVYTRSVVFADLRKTCRRLHCLEKYVRVYCCFHIRGLQGPFCF